MAHRGVALVSSIALHAIAVSVMSAPNVTARARPDALDVSFVVPAPPTVPAPVPAASPGGAPVSRAAPARPRAARAPIVAPTPAPDATDAVQDAVRAFAIASRSAALRGIFASGFAGDGDDDAPGRGHGSGHGRGTGDGAGHGGAGPCGDPIAGVWIARFHWRSLETWSFVTLEVARAGNELSGEIRVHEWLGDELPEESWRIDARRENHTRTPASGRVRGDRVELAARASDAARTRTDAFSGRVIADRIDAVWNDEARARDQRIRFRRVRCAPSP